MKFDYPDLSGGLPEMNIGAENWEQRDKDDHGGSVKLCDGHRDKLLQALEDRSLLELSPDNEEETSWRFQSVMTEGLNKKNFDPMMCCQMAIIEETIELCGKLLAFLESHGIEICPLCFLNDNHARYGGTECESDAFDRWVADAADGASDLWTELNREEEA